MNSLMNMPYVSKLLCLVFALMTLQACASTQAPADGSLAAAYETSGMVSVPPYTRTIFSTHDF